MEKSTNVPETTNGAAAPLEAIENLIGELRDTVTRFQDEQSPEAFAAIVTALGGFGMSSTEVWKKAQKFTVENPLRTAVYAGVVFFALRGLLGEAGRMTSGRGKSSHHH